MYLALNSYYRLIFLPDSNHGWYSYHFQGKYLYANSYITVSQYFRQKLFGYAFRVIFFLDLGSDHSAKLNLKQMHEELLFIQY